MLASAGMEVSSSARVAEGFRDGLDTRVIARKRALRDGAVLRLHRIQNLLCHDSSFRKHIRKSDYMPCQHIRQGV